MVCITKALEEERLVSITKALEEERLVSITKAQEEGKREDTPSQARGSQYKKLLSPRARAKRVRKMLSHQAVLVAAGAPLTRIQVDLGITPLGPKVELVGEGGSLRSIRARTR